SYGRWAWTRHTYEAIVHGRGELQGRDVLALVEMAGDALHVKSIVVRDRAGHPIGAHRRGDQAILWDLRPDPSRQIGPARGEPAFAEFDRGAVGTVELTTLIEIPGVAAAGVAFREDAGEDLSSLLRRANVPVAVVRVDGNSSMSRLPEIE